MQASVTLLSSDASQTKALSSFQTCGSPHTALLNLLDAENVDLQFAALSCLATLFQDLLDNLFLENADNQKSTPQFLKFASHAERRFHVPTLAIVESFSLFGIFSLDSCGDGSTAYVVTVLIVFFVTLHRAWTVVSEKQRHPGDSESDAR